VSDLTPADTPQLRTSLAQNYPNPFNPVTTIRFTLGSEDLKGSTTAPVLLEIYDIAGRRVAVLMDRCLAPGLYQVRWDGTGPGGEALASGVYFTRLAVGERVLSHKLVLLR
jgi:hypothetical protein